MSLTKEQKQVIETKNKNLLVSASAGSGKTFTMIERIFHLLKEENASIKDFLIVTFTNAAASEMKQKIIARILEEESINEHLKKQLDDMMLADISTLHTFCSKLVKQYFYEVSIDPASKIMEEEESVLLKNESLTHVLNAYLEKDDALFHILFETFNKKRRDAELKQTILSLYAFLKTKHNYPAFIKKVLEENYTTYLEQNESAIYVNNWFLNIVAHFKTEFELVKQKTQRMNATTLMPVVEQVLSVLNQFSSKNTYLQNLKTLTQIENFMSMPRKIEPLEEELKEEVSNLKSSLKDNLDAAKKQFGENEFVVQNEIKNAKPLLEKLLELVKAFDKEYEKLKKEKALLDFNDLEHYTLQILSNESIRTNIKNRYVYVFIDEYQDTNELQEQIIQKIVRENNAFMVGDVKQSIYMFRECDPQIFVKKYQAYENDVNSVKIDLNQNFRSERGVLEFANFVFSNIMQEETASVNYKKNASFVAGASYEKSKHNMPLVGVSIINSEDLKEEEKEEEPVIYSVLNHMNIKKAEDKTETASVLEARIIANKIYEFMQHPIYDTKTKEYREVVFSDFAILSRVRGSFLKELCKELEKYNLPLNVKYKENIFNRYEADLIHSYFRLINNLQDDISLFQVLHSPMCNLTYEELANIRIHKKDANYFYEAVMSYANCVTNETSKKINTLLLKLQEFRISKVHLTLEKLALQIIDDYDLLNYFYSLKDGEECVLNLKMLLANMKKEEFEHDLFAYLTYVENYIEEDAFEMNSASSDNSIAVTTIHASKGLEYPIVIVAGMGREFSSKPRTEEIVTNKELGFGVRFYNLEERTKNNTLVRNACLLKNKEEELAEEMRLLYVAITRAKNHLWLVGKTTLQKVEPLKSVYAIRSAKSYLNWILGSLKSENLLHLKQGMGELNIPLIDGTICKFEVINVSELKKEEQITQPFQFEHTGLESGSKLKEVFDFIYPYEQSKHLLTKSSVSEIVLKELEEEDNYSIQTLRVDELTNKKEELDFSLIGTIYHSVMQYISFELTTTEEVKQEVEALINQNIITSNAFELIDLKTILKAVLEMNALCKNAINVQKEKQFMMYVPYNEIFKNSKITDKILVQGVIDVIIEKEDEVLLIDYKTSRMSEENLKQKYRTQLRLYELAYEKANNRTVNKKLIYSFHLNHTVNV